MATVVVFIPLSQGKIATIDFEDLPIVGGFRWYASRPGKGRGTWYAWRWQRFPEGRERLQMHRAISGYPYTDHISGDGLDNRRVNMRLSSNTYNQRGLRAKDSSCTSRFRGVCWASASRKWKAAIKVDQRSIHLGYFLDEETAALAYDEAAERMGFLPEAKNFR